MDAPLYYIRSRGRVQGPFTLEQLEDLHRRGRFARHFQISTDQKEWKAATSLDMFRRPSARPPGVPAQPPAGLAQPGMAPIAEPVEERAAPEATPSSADVYAVTEPLPPPQPPAQLVQGDAEVSRVAEGEWFFARDGVESGPVSLTHLQFLVGTGELGPGDFVWNDSMANWCEICAVPALLAISRGADRAVSQSRPAPSGMSSLAILSFVFGLLGTSVVFGVGSCAAIVLGHLGLRQIRASQGQLGGRGWAVAGLVLGYAVVALGTLALIVLMFVLVLAGASASS